MFFLTDKRRWSFKLLVIVRRDSKIKREKIYIFAIISKQRIDNNAIETLIHLWRSLQWTRAIAEITFFIQRNAIANFPFAWNLFWNWFRTNDFEPKQISQSLNHYIFQSPRIKRVRLQKIRTKIYARIKSVERREFIWSSSHDNRLSCAK